MAASPPTTLAHHEAVSTTVLARTAAKEVKSQIMADLESPFWQQIEEGKFVSVTPSEGPGDGIHDCSLPQYGLVRNSRILFQIKALSSVHNFHAAVLFRKNGTKYLGAGLGGWNSLYSVFNRTLQGFMRLPLGSEQAIQKDRDYKFELEFRSGHLTNFKVDGEVIFPFNSLSLRDSLGSTVRFGHIGLYAYGETKAQVTLKVDALPARAFVVTNIDGKNGSKTNTRRDRFRSILEERGIKDIEFLDSRDLTRERPLMVKIGRAISDSDFTIVDLGLGKPRGNVFYETGIAHSLGIPTVHVGPKATAFAKVVPSDLKAQFFVLEEELETKLPATVQAILDTPSGEFDYLG